MKSRVFPRGLAVALLAAGLGVAACGGITSPGQPTPPGTAPATPSATGASAPAASASGSIAGIPFYQPASIVSEGGGSALLASPDPVTKVSDYYIRVVDAGGWTTVSKSITSWSGNLTIKKSGQGATISVSQSGSGSVISISTYPAA